METKKRVLVTGATGTLGSGLVASLVSANCEVMANFYRDEIRASKLKEVTGCALAQGDISDEATVEKLFEEPFEAVFHLAGISHDSLLPRVSKSAWDEQLRVNVQSAFLVTREALRQLPSGGRLILVSSRVGERGYIGQSAYGASKAAILGLMKSAALEGRERGIAVNALCPGFAPSEMSSGLSNAVLMSRYGENWLPDANARQSFTATCLFLLDAHITGQILHPDCRI